MFVVGISIVQICLMIAFIATLLVSTLTVIDTGIKSLKDISIIILAFIVMALSASLVYKGNYSYKLGENLSSFVSEDRTKAIIYDSNILDCFELRSNIVCEKVD